MTRQMLTGNMAAAWGARLAAVDYVPAFPITPQTEIIETLAQWFGDGTMRGKIRQHGFRTFDADRRWSRGGHRCACVHGHL